MELSKTKSKEKKAGIATNLKILGFILCYKSETDLQTDEKPSSKKK